jgi:hypothetical protein
MMGAMVMMVMVVRRDDERHARGAAGAGGDEGPDRTDAGLGGEEGVAADGRVDGEIAGFVRANVSGAAAGAIFVRSEML